MPVKEGKDSQGCYYQWGNQRKYYYKCGDAKAAQRARVKAERQGRVIEAQAPELTKVSSKVTGTYAPAYGPRETAIVPGEMAPQRVNKEEIKKILKPIIAQATPDNAETSILQPSVELFNSAKSWLSSIGIKAQSAAYYLASLIETKRQEQGDTRPQQQEITAPEIGSLIGIGPNVTFSGNELVKAQPEAVKVEQAQNIEESTDVAVIEPSVVESVWNYLKDINYAHYAGVTWDTVKDIAIVAAEKIGELRDAEQRMRNTPVTEYEMNKILGINISPQSSFSTDVSLYGQEPSSLSIENRINNALRPVPAPDFLVQEGLTVPTVMAKPDNRTLTGFEESVSKHGAYVVPTALPSTIMPAAKLPSIYNPFELQSPTNPYDLRTEEYTDVFYGAPNLWGTTEGYFGYLPREVPASHYKTPGQTKNQPRMILENTNPREI